MGVSGEENGRHREEGAIVSKALESGYSRSEVEIVRVSSSEFVPKEKGIRGKVKIRTGCTSRGNQAHESVEIRSRRCRGRVRKDGIRIRGDRKRK